jgi:DNA-binding MarR family transcriptional regulator
MFDAGMVRVPLCLLEYTTMVVQSNEALPGQLDLGYLALFLGLRVNELVLERLATTGMSGVRESHGYLIQHLIETERSITELAERMGVTQQASSKMVSELVGLGVLEVTTGQDRRAKQVSLSPHGWSLVGLNRDARKQVNGRLVRELGESRYEVARALVLECLDRLGGLGAVRKRKIRMPR